jgi:hypothetical protein
MYREPLSSKKRASVLDHRDGRDAYTLRDARSLGADGNVDHVLEVQLLNFAAGDVLTGHEGLRRCFSSAVNDVTNLNVTSRRVNQSKKGPFTAALNRLQRGEKADIEALARKGRASWLIDEGVWENIQTEIVESYEAIERRLENERMTRAHAKELKRATEAVRDVLEKMSLMI